MLAGFIDSGITVGPPGAIFNGPMVSPSQLPSYDLPKGGFAGVYRVGPHNVHAISDPANGQAIGSSFAGAVNFFGSNGPFCLAIKNGAKFQSTDPTDFYFYNNPPPNWGPGTPPYAGTDKGWQWDTSAYFLDGNAALVYLDNYQPGFSHTILGRLLGSVGSATVGMAAGFISGNQQEADQALHNSVNDVYQLHNPGGMNLATENAIVKGEQAASPYFHVGEFFNPLFGGPGGVTLLGVLGTGPNANLNLTNTPADSPGSPNSPNGGGPIPAPNGPLGLPFGILALMGLGVLLAIVVVIAIHNGAKE